MITLIIVCFVLWCAVGMVFATMVLDDEPKKWGKQLKTLNYKQLLILIIFGGPVVWIIFSVMLFVFTGIALIKYFDE